MERKYEERENSRKRLARGGKQHKKSCKRTQESKKIIEDNT